LGAFFPAPHSAVPEKTGLSAPIQRILRSKIRKDFRFYPLRSPGAEFPLLSAGFATLRFAQSEPINPEQNPCAPKAPGRRAARKQTVGVRKIIVLP
jgi:hypothetical protein